MCVLRLPESAGSLDDAFEFRSASASSDPKTAKRSDDREDEIALQDRLEVVVDGADAHARLGGLQHGAEPLVQVGPSSGDREAPSGVEDRPLSEQARVEQTDLRQAMQLVARWIEQADVDDAAHGSPELRAEVAGVKLDAIDHLRRHHRGEAAEVVDDGDRRPVDEVLRVLRGRPAHDEQPGHGRRAADPREVQQRTEGVSVGPGDAADLALIERLLDQRSRRLLAAHFDLLDIVTRRESRGRRRSLECEPVDGDRFLPG